MKKTLSAFAIALATATAAGPSGLEGTSAAAQSPVLLSTYGQGVHSYYANNYNEAYRHFSTAIDGGLEDPRAYYFRGIVNDALGNAYQAEADWQAGADLEASGKIVGDIGRALSRFQGTRRLELETIRSQAKLAYLQRANARSQARYGELEGVQGDVLRRPPTPPAQAPVTPVPTTPAPVTPPPAPTPPSAGVDPFASPSPDAAAVDRADALEGAMENPFADDPAAAPAADAPADAPAGDDPFAAPAAGDDPFSSDGGADPFGGMDGGDGAADPFGGGGSDPFGDNPFGS